MRKIIVNGKFLTQGVTGVQRYAREILRELDSLVEKGKVEIVVPEKCQEFLELKNIEIKKNGKLSGHLWEQIELPIYTFKTGGKLLNLCNTAPIISPGIVTIHDVITKSRPEFFSNRKFVLGMNLMNFWNIRRSEKIITVSNFSKKEIMRFYRTPSEKIEIIGNGWEHMQKINSDEAIIEKFHLPKKKFYLAVSSLNPNKNFQYIIKLAKEIPDTIFVIVGKKYNTFEIDVAKEAVDLKNIIWTGYVSDEELKALYENCGFFIFPSLYEGFGIPPLEALSCGGKLALSDVRPLSEIYEGGALYFNPNKIEFDLFKELKDKSSKNNRASKNILKNNSWSRSAEKLLEIL